MGEIIAFVIILVPLIFVHELGHFVMAKLVGITVLEFGIGFPPRALVLFKRGDTEYTLNWLPLGGFVRPLGEDLVAPLSDEETEEERHRLAERRADGDADSISRGVAVSDVSPSKRILFMIGGPLFNILLAVVLFAAAGMVGQQAIDHSDIVIDRLGWDSPLLRAGARPGDVVYAIDGQPAGLTHDGKSIDFAEGREPIRFAQDLLEYLDDHADTPVTLTVERGGELLDIALASGSDGFARFADAGNTTITHVNANAPAEAAGLEADDIVRSGFTAFRYPVASMGVAEIGGPDAPTLRSLDRHVIYTTGGLSRLISASIGLPVTLAVERDGALYQLTINTRANPPEGQGATGISIMTDYPYAIVREAPVEAFVNGVTQTVTVTFRVMEAPLLIIRGEISGEEARPVGIVGISQMGSQFIEESVEGGTPAPAINFAALISVALGITNLLPLPALDGGRILFTLVEMIRGKRIDPAHENMIHLIGLVALMGLMVLMIIFDLANPVRLP